MLTKATRSVKQVFANLRRLAEEPPPPEPAPRPVAQATAPMMGDAPITLSLAQIDDLRAQVRTAQARCTELERELVVARTADPQGRVGDLSRLARTMLTIVRYAFANLPPSENPKWPIDAVGELVERLHCLPDFNEDDAVLVAEMRLFVRDIEEHEIARARKRAALIASAPARARGVSLMDDPAFGIDPNTGG